MSSRAATAVLAWFAAVVAATGIGLLAVGAIGNGIVGPGQQPLSAAQVNDLLSASAVPSPAPPTPAPSPPPVAGGGSRVLGSVGGTVVATCVGGVPQVVSASPAQGFSLHDEDGEDAGRVRFESGGSRVELRLSCRDGQPVADVRVD